MLMIERFADIFFQLHVAVNIMLHTLNANMAANLLFF